MTAIMEKLYSSAIEFDIRVHPAWLGQVSGLAAEKMLRGKKTPYLYVLRAGECEGDYYVSFILPDFTVKHQPVVITHTAEGWCYENTGGGGPYKDVSIDDVLHFIMHCPKGQCTPLIASAEQL